MEHAHHTGVNIQNQNNNTTQLFGRDTHNDNSNKITTKQIIVNDNLKISE